MARRKKAQASKAAVQRAKAAISHWQTRKKNTDRARNAMVKTQRAFFTAANREESAQNRANKALAKAGSKRRVSRD